MAELIFFAGTMDCGKSTLALQTDHNHSSRVRFGLVFTRLDRAGESVLSSRIGLSVTAIEVTESLDIRAHVVDALSRGDRVQVLQVEALCWCGMRAIHNARTVDGVVVVEGSQVMVGDVGEGVGARVDIPVVSYEVLCRRHYRARKTAQSAGVEHMSREPLPFDA